jgi:tRNA U34 5-methylaminomethyl-2-thiouridine-forming methyltransferase MnmC
MAHDTITTPRIRELQAVRDELWAEVQALDRILARERPRQAALRARATRDAGRARAGRASPTARRTPREIERQRRQATAAYLDLFSPIEPRPGPKRTGMGVLVLNGYLRREGTGFVRTDKPFVVEARR